MALAICSERQWTHYAPIWVVRILNNFSESCLRINHPGLLNTFRWICLALMEHWGIKCLLETLTGNEITQQGLNCKNMCDTNKNRLLLKRLAIGSFPEELLRSVQDWWWWRFITVKLWEMSQSPETMTCNIYRYIVHVHICLYFNLIFRIKYIRQLYAIYLIRIHLQLSL